MSDIKEEAIRNYTGAGGRSRRNCARSVSDAAAGNFPLDEKLVAGLNACGGGRAPQGVCGALHAAQLIAEKYYPQTAGKVAELFSAQSGSLYCREIRGRGAVPCSQCVGHAGSIIDNLHNGGKNGT